MEEKLEALKGLASQMCQIIDGIDGKVSIEFMDKDRAWMRSMTDEGRHSKVVISVVIGATVKGSDDGI